MESPEEAARGPEIPAPKPLPLRSELCILTHDLIPGLEPVTQLLTLNSRIGLPKSDAPAQALDPDRRGPSGPHAHPRIRCPSITLGPDPEIEPGL